MTNRINQLVLNIRCKANKAMKQGFVTVAGTDLANGDPMAVPSVGRPYMSSPPVSEYRERTIASLSRLELELAFPGKWVGGNGWCGTSQRTTRSRRFVTTRFTTHDTQRHHDYPSHDVHHAASNRRIASIATNGK